MNSVAEPTPAPSGEEALAASVQKSKAAWRRLGLRLLSTTPSGLVRMLLLAGAVALLGWVLARSFVPLLPFVVGLLLAYITAPLVEGLDRILPRSLAVLLVIIGEILFLLLVVAVLVVPLAREAVQLIQSLPGPEELRAFFDRLAGYLRTLPEPTQAFIRDGLRQAVDQMRGNLVEYFQSATELSVGAVFGLIRTFGFLLGLLVLPTWLYSVMADQKRAARVVDRVLPDWVKPDFQAIVRIVDRTLSASLRGLVVQGIAVGVVTYLGLALLEQFGFEVFEYKLLAAVLAGLVELIPDIGPFLWAIPAGLVGFSHSPQMGLGLLAAYFLGRWLVHRLLVSRFEKRVVRGIHPAVLVVAIVALSQFGLLWLFLAAPVVAIVRDLFRYVYGRVSDPPRPAGLLPDEPLPVPMVATSIPARQALRRRQGRSVPTKGETGMSAG